MPELLLDTNAVSAAMSVDPAFERYLGGLSTDCRVVTSVIVEGEIRFGIARLPNGRRRARLEVAMSEIFGVLQAIIPITREVAGIYGTLKSTLWSEGRSMSENDLWIAATGLARDAVVVTRDAVFWSVPKLRVDDWRTGG